MEKGIKFSRRFLERNSQTILNIVGDELTDMQKAYIALYYSGKTIRQIAKECNVNPSTVSRTINRGMAKVHKTFKNALNLYEKVSDV